MGKSIKKKAHAKALNNAKKLAIVEAAIAKARSVGKKAVKQQKATEKKKVSAMKKEDREEAKAENKQNAKVAASAAAAKAEKSSSKAKAKAKAVDAQILKQKKKVLKLEAIKEYKRNKWPTPQVRFHERETSKETVMRHNSGFHRVNKQLKLTQQAIDATRKSHRQLKKEENQQDQAAIRKKARKGARKRVQAEAKKNLKMAGAKDAAVAKNKKADRKAVRGVVADRREDKAER